MSVMETLAGLFKKEAEHIYAGWIDQARVDKKLSPTPLEAGRHYVRLWLAEMFLNDEVSWLQKWYPAVHSLASLDFGDGHVELPNVADATRVGAGPGGGGAFVARNFQLTPTLPFKGGTLSLEAGLLALPGQNYLKGFLELLGKFAGLLNVPQLSAALALAQPLALGIQQLLGPVGGRMHLGFRNSLTAGAVRDGYLVAIRADERKVPPLYVVNDQLRTGDGLGEGWHKPLDGFDYMLFRLEVFDERDDWEQLNLIQEPLQEAIRDLADPLTEERAVFNLRRAMLRARLADELTSADKRRVVEALRQKFEEAKAGFGKSGLTGGGTVTLAHAMTYAQDTQTALLGGVPSVGEIFSMTSRLAPRAAAASTEGPAIEGLRGATEFKAEEDKAEPPGRPATTEAGGEHAGRGFFLALEGNDARYGVARCGAEFDFVFGYDVPPQDETGLAILNNAAGLEQARREEATLGLSLIPRGFTFPDGVWTKSFKFDGGALGEPLHFHLKADREPVEDSGLHVLFERDGCVLYEFTVPVRLVRTTEELQGTSPREPLALDLDEIMASGERERRRAKLVITARGDRLSILFDDEDRDETFTSEPNLITRSSLAALLARIRADLEALAGHAVWEKVSDPFNPPADGGVRRGLDKCLRLAAAAGAALYSELSADRDFAEVLKRIDALPADTLLSIRTDCAYLPWELLYPGKFQADGDAAPQAQQFWGNRFVIECLQTGFGKEYRTPINRHQSSTARFSFNLNTAIDEAFAGKGFLPVASHDAFKGELAADGVAADVYESGDDIRRLLRTENCESTLFYFYCHGQNDKPLADDHTEKLEIARDAFLEPRQLDDGVTYPRGPLVFLNSCSSGAFSPLSFTSFLTRFREKEALGLVATSFTIPAAFAAIFGQALMRRYARGEPLGRALLGLRRDLLKLGVPLGLYYSLHCPADISIRRKDAS